ncbi:MAG: isochorismatase family protein [Acidobacteria bacterium]|nr:MAG: isochorismatase family protein [Acidobacteriota bacterium]REK00186.1 MAG: isochorismatase family protein [Acidobacteriota bacterium]
MSLLLDRDRSLVVVIDVQGRLVGQVHRPELMLAGIDRLLRIADLFEVPVLLTEQYPQGLGPTEEGVLRRFEQLRVASERIEKTTFSCCGERFEEAVSRLRPGVPAARRQYVVAGIEAHVCVAQTVLGLLEAGSAVHVCWECVSGRGEEYRHWALERMRSAGAVITNHESAGFEWAGDKDHPRFKELSGLLRSGQIAT